MIKIVYDGDYLKIPENQLSLDLFKRWDWMGEGLNPKLIKGPDIFINTLKYYQKEVYQFMHYLLGPLEVL